MHVAEDTYLWDRCGAWTVSDNAVPDVSICIVNWNRADCLRECLRSIWRSKPSVSFEIIVIDNASTDDSVSVVNAESTQAMLVVNSENVGFARANNQAFELARGRYLLLLNNDTAMLSGTLDAMITFMEQHPDAGILGCKVLNPDGSLQPSCRRLPSLSTLFWRAVYLDKLFPHNRWTAADTMSGWRHDTVREVDVIMGCCMLVRRTMLDQIGPLDERFFMYSEETDWCCRAHQHGWKVYFTPEAQIIHYGGQSASLQTVAMAMHFQQSRIEYFRKHHGWQSAVAARLLGILELSLRLVYWSLSFLLRPRRRSHSTHKITLCWPAWCWLVLGRQPRRV